MTRRRRLGVEIEVGRVERLVALRAFPGAAHLSSAELVALSSIAEPLRFGKGARLIRADEQTAALFLCVEGRLRVRRDGVAGDETLEAGGIVGEAHALARDARGLECQADTDAVVLRIGIEDLEDVFEDHPAVLALTARELARRAVGEGLATLSPPARRRALDGERSPSQPPLDGPLDLVERILFLRGLSVLGGASLDGVAALAASAGEVRREPGEALFRPGEPSASFYVVLSGSVVLRPAGGGARRVEAHRGETVGELECVADLPRSFEARADAVVVALELGRDPMLDAWEDHVTLGIEHLRRLGGLLSGATPRAHMTSEASAKEPGGTR